jgi:hypothetical protein
VLKKLLQNILYQTIASAVIVIKAPNMAVKPQINTMISLNNFKIIIRSENIANIPKQN